MISCMTSVLLSLSRGRNVVPRVNNRFINASGRPRARPATISN